MTLLIPGPLPNPMIAVNPAFLNSLSRDNCLLVTSGKVPRSLELSTNQPARNNPTWSYTSITVAPIIAFLLCLFPVSEQLNRRAEVKRMTGDFTGVPWPNLEL